jgi:hypothetical protein
MLTLFAALTLFFACSKNDDDKNMTVPEGMYIGTFHRTGMDTAIVTLTFEGNRFSGQSDHSKYPAICHGSYEVYDKNIQFTDSCTWTANFNWTLILNGTYSFTHSSNELRFSRTNGNITDDYVLRKTPR